MLDCKTATWELWALPACPAFVALLGAKVVVAFIAVAGVMHLSSDLLLGGNVVAFILVVVYLGRDILSSSYDASWDSDKEHLGKPYILDPDDICLLRCFQTGS